MQEQVEQPPDGFDQFINAEVVDTVFDGREQAELSAETQNVPRVHHGAAVDGALGQFLRLGGRLQRRLQPAVGQVLVGCDHPAFDVAIHPGRGNGYGANLSFRGLKGSDARVQQCQMDVLKLLRPAKRDVAVEMLPSAAERLVQLPGLSLQSAAVLAMDVPQQLLVELVAIAGNGVYERCQRRTGVVGAGPVGANSRAHQHDACQHGGGFKHEFLARQLAFRLHAIENRFERDLMDDEPPGIPGVVELAEVPLAVEIVGALIDRMIEIVCPRVH